MPIRLQANNGNIDLKVPVRGGGIEQVQADWAQNDSTAKDYIKNRFGGYVENSVATTLYDNTPENSGEVEITLFPLNTEVGTITIDGVATTYTCVTETIDKQQCVSFGTATLAEVYSGTTDAIVAASTGTISMALIGSSYVGKHIVISIGGEVIHTIPTKFIDNNFVNKVNNAASMATAAQKDVNEIKSEGLSYTGSRDGTVFIGVDNYGNAEISRKRSEDSAEGVDIELATAGLSLANYGRYGKLTSQVVMSTIGTTDNPALDLKKARIAGVQEPEEDTDAATKKYVDTQIAAIDVPSLDGYATEQWVEGKGYLTEHQSLEGYVLKSELPTVPTNVSAFTNDSGYLTLATLPKYTGGVE